MRIIAIDDEPSPLNLIRILLSKIEGAEMVASFSNAIDALEYVRHTHIDLAFVDIEMPEMTGLDFAREVETLDNPPKIVFVTAFSEYAMDAWSTDAADYILKPFSVDTLRRAITRVEERTSVSAKKFFVQCFPSFDIMLDGKPILFHSKRGKEVCAYLILNQGHWVDIGNLVYDIFGDTDEQASKSHYRVVLSRLKQELSAYGLADIIKTEYGKIRIDVPAENCDYYRYLKGYTSIFTGEFLREYSWAEIEATRMRQKGGIYG